MCKQNTNAHVSVYTEDKCVVIHIVMRGDNSRTIVSGVTQASIFYWWDEKNEARNNSSQSCRASFFSRGGGKNDP